MRYVKAALFPVACAALTLSIPGVASAQQTGPTYGQFVSGGYELLLEGKVREAYIAALEAARIDPARFESFALAALVMHTQGADDDALEFVEQAVVLAPAESKAQVRSLAAEIQASLEASATSADAEGATASPESPEVALWRSIENSTRSADYEVYLQQFPGGTFSALATSRFNELRERERQESGSVVGSTWSGEVVVRNRRDEEVARFNTDVTFDEGGTGRAIYRDSLATVLWEQIGNRVVIQLQIGDSCFLSLNAAVVGEQLNGSAIWAGECREVSGFLTYAGNVWPEHYSARRASSSGGLPRK